MKNDLLEILACPRCSEASLDLRVSKQDKDEIVSGELRCTVCGEIYLIQEGIPRMVPSVSENSSENKKGLEENLSPQHYDIREANITYYDAMSEVYEKEIEIIPFLQDGLNQRRIEQIIKNLSERTQKELFLDLGCGTGNLLKFGERYFKRAIGMDISFNMLKQAKKNNLEVVQGDILFLPFKSSLFDVVSIFSVLHHLYDYLQIFKQISRVMNTGGFLYSDWDPTKQPIIDEKKFSWRLYRIFQHIYGYLPPPLKFVEQTTQFDTREGDTQKASIDFQKMRPDLKEIRVKAEFHEQKKGEERGIDFDRLKGNLMKNGFDNIQPTFHWAGKSINQLPLSLKTRFFFLKFQDHPLERFMENLMIISQKK